MEIVPWLSIETTLVMQFRLKILPFLCHISNINQRKLIESFLIKNIDNMNVYKASIAIDDFTSSIVHNKVPFLRKFVNKEYFLDSG